jgi:hypothetical protein
VTAAVQAEHYGSVIAGRQLPTGSRADRQQLSPDARGDSQPVFPEYAADLRVG